MPLLPVNTTDPDIDRALTPLLARLPQDAPVMVLIHGFKFSPATPHSNPHSHILSLNPNPDCRKALSWPRALGFTGTRDEEGLCLAFGWEARGTIWQAYRRAKDAGQVLGGLVAHMAAQRPDRPVHILAHSLGARVALNALPHLPPRSLGQIILMAPAEMSHRADPLLGAPAARTARFLNVTSRENDIFDWMLERALTPHRRKARTLSHGLEHPPKNWQDLQIDHPETLAALNRLGFAIAPPERRICHWSPYLRDGMFALYAALLRGTLPFGALQAQIPHVHSPRWSRLLAVPDSPAPFSLVRDAPS
ncbi:serine aminopeptidase S33 family [Rhodovulum imhoffii]|uniref:Serine aminopeptidase S33 family n=1 Tax=Rhodovulum imhoffii TaxID=365340 RepID=A0A2T5BQQ4_9RHOB|nr:alpha/beta hydrolase [Rhodovulum imhoffii]MBK5933894.1 hypothetical protein [Rhodovulum imhoffii]PTN01518.1 serine aminopeptidase S33 family [Rhodovulum imhoffii]